MRKKCLIILLAVLVAFTLSVPVLAADDQSRGFFDTLADIGMFIRDLFVPDGDYFNDQLSSLNDHINSRFAGAALPDDQRLFQDTYQPARCEP